jgi:hypothetical protein
MEEINDLASNSDQKQNQLYSLHIKKRCRYSYMVGDDETSL